MESQRTVIDLDNTSLHKAMTKLEERYICKLREKAESGTPVQIPSTDLKEMVEIFDELHDISLKLLWIHGAYVGGILVLNKRLKEFFIGKTGAKLTSEQFEVLQNAVSALETMNKIHTNLPEKDFNLNEIYEYLGL